VAASLKARAMEQQDKVNILLVDDQPAKLLSYEVVLRDLDENLLKAESATQALEILLKNEVAVVLVDVCMPGLDGFELAAMIRDHPRYQRTAILFISAVLLTESDYLRGYEMGGVDYVPVPIVPELLRAKVRVFAELYRKTRQLEKLNQELERRVAERTAEVEASAERLRESERGRSIALAAGQMGSWEWDITTGECACDAGQYRIFGIDDAGAIQTIDHLRAYFHSDDFKRIEALVAGPGNPQTFQSEVRITRPGAETRVCVCAAAMTPDAKRRIVRVSAVMIDITDRKQAEARQMLLAREVDHRARNALAVVQAVVRLTRANSQQAYVKAVEGRIHALAQAHTLLSESRWQGADMRRLVREELAPYGSGDGARVQIEGVSVFLPPAKAQNVALALHELATNSAKYGALSCVDGALKVSWQADRGILTLRWEESGGPPVKSPKALGFGTKILNATIKHQIGGNVEWEWRSSGLHCTLVIPSDADDQIGRALVAGNRENLVQLPTQALRRVLLAEDEAMIGMMMRDILLDYGLFVVGPCCSLGEAMAAAAAGSFDCAILDLNLGGESVYPVASALRTAGVPFAFVTGYGRESIDERFAEVPILQKPIERTRLEIYLDETLGARVSAVNKDGLRPGAPLDSRAS
jgi:two-component sensor histidine kinase/DNA-binding response OmpR family regulator